MKKISKDYKYSRVETKVKLFKEDLEYLTNTMINNFDYVNIYIDEYELETFSELNDIKQDKVGLYKISAYNKENNIDKHKMSITIDTNTIAIDIPDYSDLKCKAIDGIVIELITKRKTFLNYIGSGYVYWTSLFVIFILGSILKVLIDLKKINIFFYLLVTLLFVCGLMAFIAFYLRFNIKNTIILRKQRYNFYKRNKDKIIVGIIVAIITSIITALISHFIGLK